MIPQPPLRVTDSFPQGSLGPYGAAGGHIGPPLRGHRNSRSARRGGAEPAPCGNTGSAGLRANTGIGPYERLTIKSQPKCVER